MSGWHYQIMRHVDDSGEEYILAAGEAKLTLRWGCSCCKDTSSLTKEEKAFRDKVVKAVNMHDRFARFARNLGRGGSMLGYKMETERVKLLKELKR